MDKISQKRKRLAQFFGRVRASLRTAQAPASKRRHHVAISGTGRAGTTFLIQLFTQLGFDTGFQDLSSHVFENCHAGMEKDLRNEGAPYVIKDPVLCTYLDEFLESDAGANVVIDHLIVPVRDLHSAAESRRDVSRRTDPVLYPAGTPGGLWYTTDPREQETILQAFLYQLMFTAAKWNIPLILLHFPRTVRDHDYLFEKLRPALGDMSRGDFLSGFKQVAKPGLVHEYSHPGKLAAAPHYSNNSA